MLNIILFIVGYFLTKKDKGGRSDSDSVGNGSGISSKTWDKIILAGFAVVVYLVVRSNYQKYTQQNAFETIATNPNGLIAQQMKTAFEPYFNILGFNPGCDSDAILGLAPTIKDWKAVQDAYGQLYSPEILSERLQKELSNADLVKFYSLLGTGAVVGTTPTGGVVNAPITGTTPAVSQVGGESSYGIYSLPGLPQIKGKDLYVLRGKIVYVKDTSGKTIQTFTQGQRVGTCIGWVKVNGQIRVVYYLTFLDSLIYSYHNVDAYSVYYK